MAETYKKNFSLEYIVSTMTDGRKKSKIGKLAAFLKKIKLYQSF